jgi:hypothetical protein
MATTSLLCSKARTPEAGVRNRRQDSDAVAALQDIADSVPQVCPIYRVGVMQHTRTVDWLTGRTRTESH